MPDENSKRLSCYDVAFWKSPSRSWRVILIIFRSFTKAAAIHVEGIAFSKLRRS